MKIYMFSTKGYTTSPPVIYTTEPTKYNGLYKLIKVIDVSDGLKAEIETTNNNRKSVVN